MVRCVSGWVIAATVCFPLDLVSSRPSSCEQLLNISILHRQSRIASLQLWPRTAERFPLDTRICGAAAGACHQVGHWRWAAWVLEQLWQSRGKGPSTEDISLNLALATCKEGRKWQQALHMLAEAGRLVWDDVAASSLIKALGPRWAISLAILDRAPGISARAAAIASCTQARQWKQSLALITGQIDAVALSSAVNSCVQSTEWQRALALGSSYANDWYQDGILWSSLLSACQHGSAWDVALELFGQMQHTTGMHPNSAVFGTLLRSCSSSYRWEEALQQAFSMKATGATMQKRLS